MGLPHLRWSFVLSAALSVTAIHAAAEQDVQRPGVRQISESDSLVLIGRVQRTYSPRLLSVDNRLADERRVLVLVPEHSSLPSVGTLVSARGVLRRLDEAQIGEQAWSAVDPAVRNEFAGRPVLVADSVEMPAGLSSESMTGGIRQPLPGPIRGTSRREITVRPAALASLIGELAGFEVRVPYARVVGLLDPRSFLIDSAAALPPSPGFRDRVLVLVSGGTLRVPAESLVASTVTVSGVARTLLGVQASGDAPWPSRLDPDAVKRLEVRAAVIATSVRTADGVELTSRSQLP